MAALRADLFTSVCLTGMVPCPSHAAGRRGGLRQLHKWGGDQEGRSRWRLH